jgi:hypothetical protein
MTASLPELKTNKRAVGISMPIIQRTDPGMGFLSCMRMLDG